jgi:hypothetical protein
VRDPIRSAEFARDPREKQAEGHGHVALDLLRPESVEHVVKRHQAAQLVALVATVAAVGLVAGFDVKLSAADDEDGSAIIQRVIAHAAQAGIAIHATRELRAGTVSGKHQGWITVDTALDSSGAFSWRVIEEGGSERTRQKVLYELLKNEAATRLGAAGDAALTPANYDFAPMPSSRGGQVSIRLTPKRADARLIDGTLTVSTDGYPIRLEGRMAKSPSFWVRSVSMVTHYGRFAGIALPTSVETLADVRMVGRSSLTMRYRYSVVNGRTVSHAVASAPFVGPSAEILALHGSGTQQ